MEIRSCYFNGESGVRCDLSETDDLIIVRTREGSAYSILKTISALDPYWNYITLFEAFPESNVYLYKCFFAPDTRKFRDEVKRIIRIAGHPLLCYVGTVLKFTGTEIYQIYTGNIFIKFYDGVGNSQIAGILARNDLKIKSILHFGLNTYFTEPDSDIGRNVFELTQQLLAMTEVEYCHPELIVKSRKVVLNTNSIPEPISCTNSNWTLKKTGVFDAWKFSKGKGIKICIIDDGLEFDHPAFSGKYKITGARDMMDNGGTRLPIHQFSERHGTACASIACSSDPKAYGVAPEASLMPIRIGGLGSVLQSEAFYWAVQQGADVISCSWGPPDGNIFTETDNDFSFPVPDHTNLAFRYASTKGRNGKGIPIVFAAGNGREPVKNDGYASHESVIAVGASNEADEATVYSDYGIPMFCCFPSGDYKILDQNNVIKLDGVRVADRLGVAGYTRDQYYDFFDGTSASCPGVAGVIALMLAANPNLAQGEVKTIIKNACKKIGNKTSYINSYSQQFGYGLLMADQAVKLATNYKTLNASLPMPTNSTSSPRLSLHIGIDKVDPTYYKNSSVPELFGCVNDMTNMRELADSLNFKSDVLANSDATRNNIMKQIEKLGNLLDPGGLLLITYAGHGAPIPDSDGDEKDQQDESWVTYDGFLIDDEINNCLAKVPDGNRVLIISDSCHSRTVSRVVSPFGRVRTISKERVRQILKSNNQTVADLRAAIGPKLEQVAFVKLLSACMDDQFAKETNGAGVFTNRLLEVFYELTSQNKTTNYRDFIEAINVRMNDQDQIAGISNTGKESADFDGQHPFSDSSFNSSSTSPTVSIKKDSSAIQQAKKEILIVKSKKNTIKIPARTTGRSNAFSNNELRITGGKNDNSKPFGAPSEISAGTVDASEIPGSKPWDKAYQVVLSNPGTDIEYVEPDIASNIYLEDFMPKADQARALSDSEFISTYPNPGPGPKGFTWHLDDSHSQLKSANELVFPEIKFQDFPEDTERMVKIAHIDTGYLPNHPALPINLDPAAATFSDGSIREGATDFDLPLSLFEQQGHGNGTLSILAGGKIRDEDTSGEFRGFFGAIPFARVLSLKINDTVSILSGKNFAAAVDYAIAQKCDVITMSMAGLPSKVMAEAVNKAYENGVVIVSAAGNNFVKGIARILPTTTLYPARYPQVIAAVGAAINEKPYLYNAHNEALRSFDSEFMQMNYGPDDALKTTMAAYTPNLVWFNRIDKDSNGKPRFYIKRGGGTSSATPQIAAAAALYIHKHRAELEQLAGNNKWMIVELVKAALFQSASRDNPFQKYYGNGVLRAADALAINPNTLITQISRAKDAEGGGFLFKRLIRIFKGRSAFGSLSGDMETNLQTMMSTEILQLLHRDSTLHKYLDQINPEDQNHGLDAILNMEEFVRDIQKSEMASDFLKQRLLLPVDVRMVRTLNSSRIEFNNHLIKTKSGVIEIRTDGITASIKSVATDQKLEDWEGGIYHAFEIEINDSFGSRGGGSALAITDDFDSLEMDSAILIEKNVDGVPLLQWQLKGDSTDVPAPLRSIFAAATDTFEKDQFFINLSSGDTDNLRGDGLKIVKLAVKVFSWFKNPKKKNNNAPLLDLVSKMGDSKYELLVYDLNRVGGTGKEWEDPTNILNFFQTINNDPKPLLVLLPGLLSKLEKGFDEFLANGVVIQGLKTKFGRYIIGFNMPTLVQGIEDNAKHVNQMLVNSGLKDKKCSVIGRSSGGLIARFLFEELLFDIKTGQPVKSAPLILEKLVVTGTANQGTLLASRQNWANYVNIASNVANLAGLFVPVLPQIMGILKAIVNTGTSLPGVSDLDEQSKVILKLNQINISRTNYLVITSNYEPNGFLKKLFNENIIDRLIFKEEDNDTLAPVLGAIFKNQDPNYTITLLPDQFHISSEADQVNHFSYLQPHNTIIINKILNWL
ncbi:S8 family serine peptidase [Dyadobacter sp. 3J3]|uniref:S8 family serine peptidase n=1 Tax=Dyadobacter sp. 3J3 TaxID=2606600 RepID=UPI00135C5787|nr:S8 family serine peptidase [Dyadobacter sp. 3J3]